MAANKNFKHITVRFPTALKARIDEQQERHGANSVSAVIRAELDQVLISRRTPRKILTQAATAPLTSLWLPVSQVSVLRERAEAADVRLGDLIVTLISARPLAPPEVVPQ